LADAGFRERPTHRRLVARAAEGGRWVMGQTQALGAKSGGHHALIVDAHDCGERGLAGPVGDLLGRTRRIRQPHGQGAFAHRRRHRCPALGGHRNRDAEIPRRRQEVLRAVGA
jgi:hypothetical protein